MKKLWINKRNAPELLLFFNGWGMDEKPFKHLAIDDDLDVLDKRMSINESNCVWNKDNYATN